ncbi:C1 family peptidase [Armatimonas rosea]|uniref:Peptidase C1A papain C-terminal domain-containing protein n=1 Tax=Armatimonas rosea TaxID=685828 RepID=A0A7W9W7L2_ARMRO|nr:C1 family peptidase [Armatimonas rosea]MBB6051210.1 hypothetical protein [Armatimonas rosea]
MERRTFLLLTVGTLCSAAVAQPQARRAQPPSTYRFTPTLVTSLKLKDPTTHSSPTRVQEWIVGKLDTTVTFNPAIFKALQPDADLRPLIASYGLPIKAQGARGTCSVFAMTFLLEYNWASWGEKNKTALSEEYLNWATNKATNNQNDGDFFKNIAAGFKSYGVGDAALAPYQSAFNPGWQPTKSAIDGGTYRSLEQKFWVVFDDGVMGKSQEELDKVCHLLDNKIPVAIGQAWPNTKQGATYTFGSALGLNFLNDFTGPKGGHSMVAVGYKRSKEYPGGGYLIFRNSWGTGSGYEGYWLLSFNYVRKYAYDAYAAAWDGIK